MSISPFIQILSIILGLSVATNRLKSSAQLDDSPEEFKEPVARRYKVLYWYVALHVLYDMGVSIWIFLFYKPWNKYTSQYIAQHHLHGSVQFLQTLFVVNVLAFIAVPIALYAYVLLSKRIKYIVAIMIVFVGFDVSDLFNYLTKSTYHLLFGVIATVFAFLVLWSLYLRESDFLKLLRFK